MKWMKKNWNSSQDNVNWKCWGLIKVELWLWKLILVEIKNIDKSGDSI